MKKSISSAEKSGEGKAFKVRPFLGVNQAESVLEGANSANKLTHANCEGDQENLTSGIEDGQVFGGATSTPKIALCLDSGLNFVVIGERRYTLDQLRLHGHLSVSDVSNLGYVLSYLKSVAQSVGA